MKSMIATLMAMLVYGWPAVAMGATEVSNTPIASSWDRVEGESEKTSAKWVRYSITSENEIPGLLESSPVELMAQCVDGKTSIRFEMKIPLQADKLGDGTEKPMQEIWYRFAEDRWTDTEWPISDNQRYLSVPNSIDFARRLAKHQKLRVGIEPAFEDEGVARFLFDDFSDAAAELEALCSWPPPVCLNLRQPDGATLPYIPKKAKKYVRAKKIPVHATVGEDGRLTVRIPENQGIELYDINRSILEAVGSWRYPPRDQACQTVIRIAANSDFKQFVIDK